MPRPPPPTFGVRCPPPASLLSAERYPASLLPLHDTQPSSVPTITRDSLGDPVSPLYPG